MSSSHWKMPWLNWATAAMVIDTIIVSIPYFIKLNWNRAVELNPLVGLYPDQICGLVGSLLFLTGFILWINWVAWDRFTHRNVSAGLRFGGGSRSIASGYSPGHFYLEWDETDLSGEE